MARRALIVGGGIAGLSSAIALRDAGFDVEIFEQAPELVPMGAALSLWPNAMTVLSQLKCDALVREQSSPIDALQLAEPDGKPIFSIALSDILLDEKAYLPPRSLLQKALLGGLGETALNLSHRIVDFAQNAEGVSATFENGETVHGDLLIAADGIRSTIAAQILQVPAHHCGYGGVLGMSDPVATSDDRGFSGEYWGYHERTGMFDLPDGGKYWFYMKNEVSPEEAAEVTHDFVLQRMAGWHPSIMTAVEATDPERLIPFSIHAKPPPKKLGYGRIICVGDAAHAMEPNLGQGGCQSLEDAIALGIATRTGDIHQVLPRFEKMRLKRVRKFVSLSKQGAIAPHHLSKSLSRIAKAGMKLVMPLAAKRQMAFLYRLPDYAAVRLS